jgi:hypothetical protein
MKVNGYKVITQVTTEALEKEVKKNIKAGWILQGGASGYTYRKGPSGMDSETAFIQAMVKYKY